MTLDLAARGLSTAGLSAGAAAPSDRVRGLAMLLCWTSREMKSEAIQVCLPELGGAVVVAGPHPAPATIGVARVGLRDNLQM